jgi:hypothetical protein
VSNLRRGLTKRAKFLEKSNSEIAGGYTPSALSEQNQYVIVSNRLPRRLWRAKDICRSGKLYGNMDAT